MNTERVEPTCKRVTMYIKMSSGCISKTLMHEHVAPVYRADTSIYDNISISEGEMLRIPEFRANHNKDGSSTSLPSQMHSVITLCHLPAIWQWSAGSSVKLAVSLQQRLTTKFGFISIKTPQRERKTGTVARGHKSSWNNSQSATFNL